MDEWQTVKTLITTHSVASDMGLYCLLRDWTSTIYYLMLCLKIAGWVANSVDPDEMLHSAASHLGLHCLLRPVCLNTYGKDGIFCFAFIFSFHLHVEILKHRFFDWLCWGLTTRQPLRVILCRLPEKGRKEIEERVEEMKERDREERGTGKKVKKQKK